MGTSGGRPEGGAAVPGAGRLPGLREGPYHPGAPLSDDRVPNRSPGGVAARALPRTADPGAGPCAIRRLRLVHTRPPC